jgi:hypothetical protein
MTDDEVGIVAGAQDRGYPEIPAAGNTREGTARRVLKRAVMTAAVPIALMATLYVAMFFGHEFADEIYAGCVLSRAQRGVRP